VLLRPSQFTRVTINGHNTKWGGLIRCFLTGHWRLLRQPAMLTGLQIVESIATGASC